MKKFLIGVTSWLLMFVLSLSVLCADAPPSQIICSNFENFEIYFVDVDPISHDKLSNSFKKGECPNKKQCDKIDKWKI